MRSSFKYLLGSVPLALTPALAQASDCENNNLQPTTPSSDFEILGDGATVLHKPTNLVWSRCNLGQTWNGSTCNGDADETTWQEALEEVATLNASGALAGQDDWRVPNIKELGSIVERCKRSPAINEEIFPENPGNNTWSSTPHPLTSGSDPEQARTWQVSWWNGSIASTRRDENHTTVYENLIRVVRDHDTE